MICRKFTHRLFLFLSLFCSLYGRELKIYKNLIYTNLPDGLKRITGTVIDNSNYSIAIVREKDNIRIWFEKVLRHSDKGKPIFKIMDEVILYKTYKILYDNFGSAGECGYAKNKDVEIIAYFKMPEDSAGKDFTNIIKAWRANRKTEKLEEITTKNLVCENECKDGCEE